MSIWTFFLLFSLSLTNNPQHKHTRTHRATSLLWKHANQPNDQLIISATCIINSQSPSSFSSLPFHPLPPLCLSCLRPVVSHVADERALTIHLSVIFPSTYFECFNQYGTSKEKIYSYLTLQCQQPGGQTCFSPLGGSSETWRRRQTWSTGHLWP